MLIFLQMYHTWTSEPLWPLPTAPAPPHLDTTYRVIAELSGSWEGGTLPGLYANSAWQVSREIAVPDSAWLYLPYLIGEVALYVEGRLWSVGEKSAWVPLLGPGKARLLLKGKSPGGIVGGAYLFARKGAVAWPISTHLTQATSLPVLSRQGQKNPLEASGLALFRRGVRKMQWPLWVWALNILLWGGGVLASFPIREAHWRGPWANTPPHPIENMLGFGIVGLFIFMTAGQSIFSLFIGVSLLLEGLFCFWMRCPIEKLWQSWVPILALIWVLYHSDWVPQEVLWWGGWGIRSLLLTLYMPRLAYLCSGNLFLYILIFA